MRSAARGRPVVLIAVLAVHALLVFVVVLQTRTRLLPRMRSEFETLVTFLEPDPKPPEVQPQRLPSAVVPTRTPPPVQPAPAEDVSSAPVALPEGTGHGPVDWMDEAHRTAAAMSKAEAAKRAAVPKDSRAMNSPSEPEHHAGEEYQLPGGETIIWVNPYCYVSSGLPPIGVPDTLARARTSHTTCPGFRHGPPRGDLFKGMEAYKRLHPPDPPEPVRPDDH